MSADAPPLCMRLLSGHTNAKLSKPYMQILLGTFSPPLSMMSRHTHCGNSAVVFVQGRYQDHLLARKGKDVGSDLFQVPIYFTGNSWWCLELVPNKVQVPTLPLHLACIARIIHLKRINISVGATSGSMSMRIPLRAYENEAASCGTCCWLGCDGPPLPC